MPSPFTDQTTTKKRPAIIINSDDYQRNRPDVILIAVTSQIRSAAGVGEIAVRHWKEAGLLKPLIATVEKRLLIRRLGKLGVQDRNALHCVLKTILGE